MQEEQKNMLESLQKLQDLLQKLFRADAADLDFGIYRIINYRREQLQTFIDEELPSIVNDTLDANSEAESAHEELKRLEKQVRDEFDGDVLDGDGNLLDESLKKSKTVREYLQAREQLGSPQTRNQREDVVYNHLYTFFSRYYDNGDFIPRRRYSQTERYAVPYNGEEVYLHWANRDQYYVKSGEHFSDYRFKSQGTTTIFDLQDVDIEKDNVKGDKRFFIPIAANTKYNSETDEVRIPFEYRPLTDEEKKLYSGQKQQDKIIDAAEEEILTHIDNYNIQSELGHEIEGVTLLKKHLRTYTRRNTADFFIHKDLKKFLDRELDIYIKNEVIPLTNLILNKTFFNKERERERVLKIQLDYPVIVGLKQRNSFTKLPPKSLTFWHTLKNSKNVSGSKRSLFSLLITALRLIASQKNSILKSQKTPHNLTNGKTCLLSTR